MTGTLPLFHGVRDNGGFLVPPALVTLAEVFKARGYETSAFVGAYVLDSKWGLNQGFDTYFDNFDLSKFERISLGTVQRPANEVMDEALGWLEKKKDKKFFTWIHLYDPHTPYKPPAAFAERYPNRPYAGEIAFADSQLGRLVEFLKSNRLLDGSMIVFASDHGESLGEHEESTHGFFVYQGAVHVPLIIATPFPELWGRSTAAVVSLTDIMPTVLEMAGIPPPPQQVQGQSLVPLFFRPQSRRNAPAYSETFYPRFHFGWSELQAIQNERFKLILAPVPELYDLVEDPQEQKNLVYLEKKAYEELKATAERFISRSSENAYELGVSKIDEETREKLAALGYIGSFTDPSKLKGKKLGNPREKIVVFNKLSNAREMGLDGKVEEATKIIKAIIAEDPDIMDAYFALGNIYFKNGNYEEAIRYFRESLDRKPDDSLAIINIANAYRRWGKLEEAEKILLASLAKGLSDSQFYFILGGMKVSEKKESEAIPYFEKCISLNSDSAASHNALATIYLNKKDLAKAEQHARAALAINPSLTGANYHFAQVLEEKGDLAGAAAAYEKELESSPTHFRASYNLSRLMRLMGRVDQEEMYLKKTMEISPEFPLPYFYLARIYLNRGERYQEAIDLVKKGIELKPDRSELPLGYFLLADLYNRTGHEALSQEYAQKGQELAAALGNSK
jgi:tetratricopeptide (TPR) repeat protein